MPAKPAAVTQDQVLAYLQKNAPDVARLLEKDLTVGDVHATTALGNDRKKKPALSLVEAARAKVKPEEDAAVDKADGEVSWRAAIAIEKAQPDEQKIYGWASIVEVAGVAVVDKQDDVIEVDDLRRAAEDFVLYSRMHGDMHMRKGTGRLIQSMVFTKETAAQGLIALDPVTGDQLFGWYVGFKVDEPSVWDAFKRGERPELSIGGRGERVPL